MTFEELLRIVGDEPVFETGLLLLLCGDENDRSDPQSAGPKRIAPWCPRRRGVKTHQTPRLQGWPVRRVDTREGVRREHDRAPFPIPGARR